MCSDDTENMQGISNAPCCKSFEYRPLPLTFISTLPLYLTGYSREEKQTRWEKFQWSWFLTFKFLVDLTKICGISRGKPLFCLKFPRVKLKNEKFQKVFQKSMSSNPLPHSPFPQFFFWMQMKICICFDTYLGKYPTVFPVLSLHAIAYLLRTIVDGSSSLLAFKFLRMNQLLYGFRKARSA